MDALPALENQQKGLGIRWDTKSDNFQFEPSLIVKAAEEVGNSITKRKMLSISARVFDPIGFLAPTTLLLKIIYQQLWEKGVDRDEFVPPEVQTSWKSIMKGLSEFQQLKITRWIGFASDVISAEIYVFGDASEAANGGVAYARLQKKNKILTSSC